MPPFDDESEDECEPIPRINQSWRNGGLLVDDTVLLDIHHSSFRPENIEGRQKIQNWIDMETKYFCDTVVKPNSQNWIVSPNEFCDETDKRKFFNAANRMMAIRALMRENRYYRTHYGPSGQFQPSGFAYGEKKELAEDLMRLIIKLNQPSY